MESKTGRSGFLYFILFILFVAQFLLFFRPHALAWDGVFYYIYARSIVCDRDLRLGNDLVLSYDAVPSRDFADKHLEQVLTPTGRVANTFAIGASLLWLPWFALIYGLVRLAGLVGIGPQAITCYEWPFVWGMATASCIYGWIGVLTGFRLARQLVGRWAALAASATVMFATPLVYYQFREPFYAHAASAMCVALFVAAWWRSSEQKEPRFSLVFLLGTLGGLAALVRWQNIAYLVLPGLTFFAAAWSAARGRRWQAVRRSLFRILMVGLGASSVLTLQFAVWYVFYGRLLTVPQGSAFMEWSAPWLWHVLLSSFHGLLPWMPLVLPAAAGLVLLARRLPELSIPLLVAFLLQVYVNSCARDWFGAGGYGARRFSNALVILLIGYAALLAWRQEVWYRLLGIGLSALAVLHQWLILRYGFADGIGGHVVSMEPTYRWYATGNVQFVQQLLSYVPTALQNLPQALILSASPLSVLTVSFSSFVRQILLLACILVIVYLLWTGWRRLAHRWARSARAPRLLSICMVLIVALVDWWLLTQA